MVDLESVAKWIGIFTVITTAIWKIGKPISVLLYRLNKHLDKAEADELGLRTLLKYRLTVISRRVILRKGITVFERAILSDGLRSYEGLGGNGEVGTLAKEALSKPIVNDAAFDEVLLRGDID